MATETLYHTALVTHIIAITSDSGDNNGGLHNI